MRIVGAILIIFMTMNAMASAHIDLCHMSESPCPSESIEKCPEVTSNQEQSEDSNDSSHSHCKVHCSHQIAYYSSFTSLGFSTFESVIDPRYSFVLKHAFLEGPFRPPLA